MLTLLNILLAVPSTMTKGKTSVEMYNDSWCAVVAFFAFLVLLFIFLWPVKTKNSRIRNK